MVYAPSSEREDNSWLYTNSPKQDAGQKCILRPTFGALWVGPVRPLRSFIESIPDFISRTVPIPIALDCLATIVNEPHVIWPRAARAQSRAGTQVSEDKRADRQDAKWDQRFQATTPAACAHQEDYEVRWRRPYDLQWSSNLICVGVPDVYHRNNPQSGLLRQEAEPEDPSAQRHN